MYHYNVLLETVTSVLQERRGLTKELYFIIFSRRKSSFHAKSLFAGFTCFDISIYFSRSKRVNKKIISLCTRSDGNLLIYKIGAMVSEIHVFKRRRICENYVCLYFVLCVIFPYNVFAHSYFLTCSPP